MRIACRRGGVGLGDPMILDGRTPPPKKSGSGEKHQIRGKIEDFGIAPSRG